MKKINKQGTDLETEKIMLKKKERKQARNGK